MNILYVSYSFGHPDAGPTWSIPASVKAQSKIDNVLWVNIVDVECDHWKVLPQFHNLKEFEKLDLDCMPIPFNHPDLIVFEEIYSLKLVSLARQAKKRKVPYVIIPRGGLTKQSFNNHSKWKKQLTHPFLFDPYVKNALAVQYLSEQECLDTRKKICPNAIIIPNGIYPQKETKTAFSESGIKGLFIGRIDMYHKGLDLLLEVISKIQDELRDAGFSISIHGPETKDTAILVSKITEAGVSDIVKMGEPLFGDAKAKTFLNSDVFFLTSRTEGMPMGLIEALSYGLPAFVTRGSCMLPEIVSDDAGWGCEFDEEEMISVFRKMLADKSHYMTKGQNAIQLANKYDWDELAKQFHSKVSELLSKND